MSSTLPPVVCGELTGYPRPRCTLPAGHAGAHAVDVVPEEMSEAVAEALAAHDQFRADSAELRATSDRLRRRIRLNVRITFVLLFLAGVNLLSIAVAWHAVL